MGASQAWVDWTRAIGDLHAARDRHSCQHPRQWALTTGQGPGLNGRQQRCAGQLPGFECETASLRGERWSSSLADCPLAQRLTCCPDQGSPKLDGVGEQGCLEHGGLGPLLSGLCPARSVASVQEPTSFVSKLRTRDRDRDRIPSGGSNRVWQRRRRSWCLRACRRQERRQSIPRPNTGRDSSTSQGFDWGDGILSALRYFPGLRLLKMQPRLQLRLAFRHG